MGLSEQPNEADSTHHDWSAEEVGQIITDYFEMLRKELLCQPYIKAKHRRSLLPLLDRRSETSIERKHQNISGVLIRMGLPYIEGYKPLGNFQKLLADEVVRFLDDNPNLVDELGLAPLIRPKNLPDLRLVNPAGLIVDPPEITLPRKTEKPWRSLKGRRIDFAERDAHNRELGILGEEFALWYEQQRLRTLGRDDLANQVRWMSRDVGDGLGFDILSFDVDGSDRYIEVKATGLGKYFPFLVTDLEVRCSNDVDDRFFLYRVFNVGTEPRLYLLQGSLERSCEFRPAVYQAGPFNSGRLGTWRFP